MKLFLRSLFAVFILVGIFGSHAMAQTAPVAKPQITIDKRKLLVQPRNADGTIQMVSFWEDPVLWVRDEQQVFYGAMAGTLRAMRSGPPLAAGLTLMLLSFGYGIFHAAGPGHGKAVISAWLLATENQLRRGIAIAFMSAIFQALTAVTTVSVLLLLVSSVGATAKNIAGFLESASYFLIGLMGLYLIATAFRSGLLPVPLRRAVVAPLLLGAAASYRFDTMTPLVNPGHIHGPDCGCHHSHVPTAQDVKGEWSLSKALSLAFAVGIRPCTGALLVLIFANALGLYWAGVASTFVMALGTFITVSVIAALAVYSKKLAMKLAAKDDRWLRWAAFGLRLGGGVAIAGFGLILFLGSLGGTSTTM